MLETCVWFLVDLTHPEDQGGGGKQMAAAKHGEAAKEEGKRGIVERNSEVYWYGKRQRAILIRAVQP